MKLPSVKWKGWFTWFSKSGKDKRLIEFHIHVKKWICIFYSVRCSPWCLNKSQPLIHENETFDQRLRIIETSREAQYRWRIFSLLKLWCKILGKHLVWPAFGSHWELFLENEPWKTDKFFSYCIAFHISILHVLLMVYALLTLVNSLLIVQGFVIVSALLVTALLQFIFEGKPPSWYCLVALPLVISSISIYQKYPYQIKKKEA